MNCNRLFAISDIHVDYPDNFDYMLSLKHDQFQHDALILAGDVSNQLNRLDTIFQHLSQTFKIVFYVPGNHELWIRNHDANDSIEKFHTILQCCNQYNIQTSPHQVTLDQLPFWIVPLFSWYIKPGEGEGSLYLPKEAEDKTEKIWCDNMLCQWPEGMVNRSDKISAYFLNLNTQSIQQTYDAPVISFSHFLPRQELMFLNMDIYHHICSQSIIPFSPQDPTPQFNFSRVAGCEQLEQQIRKLQSIIHIYGHQHRNRERVLGGICYLSNCLGYPKEQKTDLYGKNRLKTIHPQTINTIRILNKTAADPISLARPTSS